MRTARSTLVALAVLLALVAGACGDDDDGGSGASASTPPGEAAGAFPVTLDTPAGPLEIEARPESIVSLSPTATEILFAVGAGGQVTAAERNSDHPPEAPKTDLDGVNPNLEAIAGYQPDLVVASNDIGDLVAGLEKLGVPVLLQPAAETFDDIYEQIEQLGEATGHAGKADEVVQEMQAEIEELAADAPPADAGLTYFHELDDTFYTVTSETFIGRVYALAGLENVADAAADKAGGYPQLSNEFIVEADPDIIFLADTVCCGQSAATVEARPGWVAMTAVRNGDVVELDDAVASRWGPRVVDFLRQVVAAAKAAAGRGGG